LLLHWDLTRFASSLVSTFSHRHAWISAPLLFDHLHTRIRRNATFDTGFKSLYLRSISNMKRCTASQSLFETSESGIRRRHRVNSNACTLANSKRSSVMEQVCERMCAVFFLLQSFLFCAFLLFCFVVVLAHFALF